MEYFRNGLRCNDTIAFKGWGSEQQILTIVAKPYESPFAFKLFEG
jgi:hypothetical protein